MRFLSVATAALAVVQGVYAVDIQKAIIMSFPKETPDDVITRAMDDIRKAGGTITHEYKLLKYEAPCNHCRSMQPSSLALFAHERHCDFAEAAPTVTTLEGFANSLTRGFAAKAPQKMLETMTVWTSEYHAVIEEDQMVEIANPSTP